VGAYVYLRPGTKRTWESAKRALGFLTIVQDGDDEGVLKMGDLPTADRAEIIRKLLGLRKVASLTDEQRATLQRFSFARDKSPVSEQIIDVPQGGRYHPSGPAPGAAEWPLPDPRVPVRWLRDDSRRNHDQMKTSTRRRASQPPRQ
jgi:hypothetical protein